MSAAPTAPPSSSLGRRFIDAIDRRLPQDVLAGDVERLRRARCILGCSLILIVLGLVALAFTYWALPGSSWQRTGLTLAVAMSLTASVPTLIRRGASQVFCTHVLITASWAVIVATFTLVGGINGPLMHWCALLPLLAVLMGNMRAAWIWGGIAMITLTAFAALDFAGVSFAADGLQDLYAADRLWIQRFVDVGSWVAVLLTVGLVYDTQQREQTQRLAEQNAQLEGEIAQRTQAEERTRYLAYYDELTTLPNRRLFEEQLAGAIDLSERNGRLTAVLYLDLDGFKGVNDTMGHAAGDELLVQVAARLRESVRISDSVGRANNSDQRQYGIVSRRGGDEFTVLLSEVRNHREAAFVADRILRTLSEPFSIEDEEVRISVSIGIAIPTNAAEAVHAAELLRNADIAMYHAKESGRNGFRFYEEAMNRDTVARSKVASELRVAVTQNQLELFYQPIVRPESHELMAVEALVRWHHPDLGLLAAGEFIEIAEERGLTIPIGEWAIATAAMDYAKWRSQGIAPPRVAVNISGAQFRRGNVFAMVQGALREHDMPPTALEIEITESAMLHNVESTQRCLRQLKEMGVTIALDDFGTGYSSLSHLREFTVNRVKIDRAFVNDIGVEPEAEAIVKAILAMAHQLGLGVVAEGIETEAQEQFLVAHGCRELQGYRFGKPRSARAFAERFGSTAG